MSHVALVGTTASGKSDLALALARRRGDVEIVSIDSMCVYREMDLATAKATPAARAEVPHHLVDLVDPAEEFSVSAFQTAARDALDDIDRRGRQALFVGGTGLHFRAVIDGLTIPGRWPEERARFEAEAEQPGGVERLYRQLVRLDPLGATRTTPSNRRRIVRALEVTVGSGRPFSSFGPGLRKYPEVETVLVGLVFHPDVVDRRIAARFRAWMDAGLLHEVETLAERPGGLSRTARQALGYRELLAHLEEGEPLEACVERAIQRTQAFARRQWSWFRRDPRIRWADDPKGAIGLLEGAFSGARTPASAPRGPSLSTGPSQG